MTVWLYQMNPKRELEDGEVYTPDDIRDELASGENLKWSTRQIRPRELAPKAGDTIIYWFVILGTDEPSLHGLGVILGCYECPEYGTEYKCICHRPVFPSKYLQNKPMNDNEIRKIIDEIRDTNRAFATMFEINDSLAEKLFAHIRNTDFA